jgi:myo-inositol 2-dehydrogenase / D-chiro-inositol 1-dehydrogenase
MPQGRFFKGAIAMRIGIIGAGSMGQVHAAAWLEAGAQVVAVYSASLESALSLAPQYGARVCSSLTELLEHVDVVDLCVPTHLHHAMTLEAATAGKHVVCEKPMALELSDARAMIMACDKAGVRLFIAHVLRFFPQYRASRDAVKAGQIGDLGVMRLKRAAYQPRVSGENWFLDSQKSGGMILDLMVHDFDYARWLGGSVTRVFAKSARASRIDSPTDYALVTLEFESGAMAQVEGGWAYPAGVFRTGFDIAGSSGLIEWSSDDTNTVKSFLEPVNSSAAEVGLPLSILAEDPYVTQIKHVKLALETGSEFLVTPQEALEALRIGLAAKRSLETGRTISISEVN